MDGVLGLTQPFRLSESTWKPSKTALLAPLRMHCVLSEKLFHAVLAEIMQRKQGRQVYFKGREIYTQLHLPTFPPRYGK